MLTTEDTKSTKNKVIVRVVTGVLGAGVAAAAIVIGGFLLFVLLLILSLVGMYEFFKAMSDKHKPVHFAAYLYCITFYAAIAFGFGLGYVAAGFLLLICVLAVPYHKTVCAADVMTAFFGFFYIGVFLSLIYFLWARNPLFAVIPLAAAWGSDTGAYVFGKFFGKRKLAPVLSPNKTVEGAVGGVLTAAAFVVIASLIYGDMTVLPAAGIGAACAVPAQLGDLFASTIKRRAGIKDFGRFFPGHGGVLDRFDSVLLAVPFMYLITSIL